MKYFVDFQHLGKGAQRPSDDGEVMPIEVGPGTVSLLPAVGDYVQIDNSMGGERASISGRVRSRLFRYFGIEGAPTCAVNIVVEETSDDWGKLVKE